MVHHILLPLLAAVGANAQRQHAFSIGTGPLAPYVGTGLVSNDPGHPQDVSYTFCPDRPRSGCEVKIDVPDSCEPPAAGTPSLCPVVFYLNGAGGSNRWTSRVRPRPDDGLHVQGLIGVYPLGDSGWNTGPRPTNRCAFTDYDCTSDPDETGFVADIISYLREQGAGGNVYVVGGSNGGALAHRLAANAGPELPIKGIVAKVSQLLATPYMSGPGQLNHNRPGNGIGPFSNGDLPVVTGRDSEKVSVLSVTGTHDKLIPYDGGKSSAFGYDDKFELMSALQSMETWALHNGCARATDPIESSHIWSDAHGNAGIAKKYSYAGCEEGVIVEYYSVEEGGHGAGDVSIDGVSVDYALVHDFITRVESQGMGDPTVTPTTPTAALTLTAPTLATTASASW